VDLVRPVDRDQERGERLGDPGLGEIAGVDPAQAGDVLDQAADDRLGLFVGTAHEHVALHLVLEVLQRLARDRVERPHHPDAGIDDRLRLLGRRPVPRAYDVPGSAPHGGPERARAVDDDRAGLDRRLDRTVGLGLSLEGHRHDDDPRRGGDLVGGPVDVRVAAEELASLLGRGGSLVLRPRPDRDVVPGPGQAQREAEPLVACPADDGDVHGGRAYPAPRWARP
jgi:hypothetical protein